MKRKGFWVFFGCMAGFCLLIALLRHVDVQAIGPQGTAVGLARLNAAVFKLCGAHLIWYDITDWFGVSALAVGLCFAAAGLIQWIRRRAFRRVDGEILVLGGLYLLGLAAYVLFEQAVVNYRPVLMPATVRPEASFPSSHTMLVWVVLGSAAMLAGRYLPRMAAKIARAVCAALIAVTVVGRLVSGVHWFTDIVGGTLLGVALLGLYQGVMDKMSEKKGYVIRPETAADHRAVEQLIREAFWNVYRPGCSEHYVIHRLREDPAFVRELDFVMEQDGVLIGQNMFMRTVILADDGREIPVLTMGPICVDPAIKRRGFGKALLDYSLKQAAALGFGAVLFEGNIAFYGKSGFTFAREFGIRYHDLPQGADDSFFLCRELIPGYLDGVRGVYQTPAGYYVPEGEVEAFDKQFPPKEKKKLPGQIFG